LVFKLKNFDDASNVSPRLASDRLTFGQWVSGQPTIRSIGFEVAVELLGSLDCPALPHCRRVEFCAVALLHLPVAAEIPSPRNRTGSRRTLDQFPSVRLSRGTHLPLAHCPPAGSLRGHLGHGPLSAKTLELLPRRGSFAAVRRSHGSAHDLVSSACAFLLGISLTLRKLFQARASIRPPHLVRWASTHLGLREN
jgi:hypothetical protein